METIEYRTAHKSAWGDGPWQAEPDKKQWRDPATGYACLAVRNRFGAWCGYVGLPPGHPLFGRDYGDIDGQFAVHGGLNFSGLCDDDEQDAGVGICHVDPGGPGVWWLGFDCGHAFDLAPALEATLAGLRRLLPNPPPHPPPPHPLLRKEYRPLAYVEAEVTDLARQLQAFEGPARG